MKVKDYILDGFAVSLVAYLNNEYKAEGQFHMSGDSNKMEYFSPDGEVMLVVNLTEKKAKFISPQSNPKIQLVLCGMLEYCGFVLT
jgi:hypothetical protein